MNTTNEFTFSQRKIKNTATCGMILMEHPLNTGRRPQTSERATKSPHNQVRQKKKEKKKREKKDRTFAPGRELRKRKHSYILESPFINRDISQDGRRASEP